MQYPVIGWERERTNEQLAAKNNGAMVSIIHSFDRSGDHGPSIHSASVSMEHRGTPPCHQIIAQASSGQRRLFDSILVCFVRVNGNHAESNVSLRGHTHLITDHLWWLDDCLHWKGDRLWGWTESRRKMFALFIVIIAWRIIIDAIQFGWCKWTNEWMNGWKEWIAFESHSSADIVLLFCERVCVCEHDAFVPRDNMRTGWSAEHELANKNEWQSDGQRLPCFLACLPALFTSFETPAEAKGETWNCIFLPCFPCVAFAYSRSRMSDVQWIRDNVLELWSSWLVE